MWSNISGSKLSWKLCCLLENWMKFGIIIKLSCLCLLQLMDPTHVSLYFRDTNFSHRVHLMRCWILLIGEHFGLDWSSLDAGGARAELETSDVYQRQESSSFMDNQSEHMYDSSNLGVSVPVPWTAIGLILCIVFSGSLGVSTNYYEQPVRACIHVWYFDRILRKVSVPWTTSCNIHVWQL